MELNDFQLFFTEHQKNYEIKEEDRLAVITLGLAGESGEVVEIIKKLIRDGKLDLNALALELGDVLAYVSIIASYFNLTLDEIANGVIEKNKSRLDQGKLHG